MKNLSNDQNVSTLHEDQAEMVFDAETASAELVNEKLADARLPRYQAEFDAEEAERAGAFNEDALDESSAVESGDDLNDELEPAFLDDDGPSSDLPAFITTTNARELFDLQEGETVIDAIARKAKEG
jgi:hypothetical protein|nr:TraD protein [uncultured bacterium]